MRRVGRRGRRGCRVGLSGAGHLAQGGDLDLGAGHRVTAQPVAGERLLLDQLVPVYELRGRDGGAAHREDECHEGNDHRRRRCVQPAVPSPLLHCSSRVRVRSATLLAAARHRTDSIVRRGQREGPAGRTGRESLTGCRRRWPQTICVAP